MSSPRMETQGKRREV